MNDAVYQEGVKSWYEGVGFVLNPFNFTYYGSIKGNILANKIVEILSEKFGNDPMTIDTLIKVDEWLQHNQNQFSI